MTKEGIPTGTDQAHLVLGERDWTQWGVLARNVCDLVEKPRVPRKEMRAWDQEQVQMFLAEAKRQASPFFALYATAISTGMRAGELLGPFWRPPL